MGGGRSRGRLGHTLGPLWRMDGWFVQALPLLLLALSLVTTALLYRQQQQTLDTRRRALFTQQVGRLESSLTTRLLAYEEAVRGAQAFFAADPTTSRAAWRRYVDMLDLPRRYPGVNGLGVISYVPRARLTAFESAAHADGAPAYRVWPAGPRAAYFPIRYIEPLELNRRALGYDVRTELRRRAAAERARDTGAAIRTAKITLVQDATRSPGFLLILPLYQGGADPGTATTRRAALVGWVYAPIRMPALMQGLAGTRDVALDVAAFDGTRPTPATLLYESATGPTPSGALVQTTRLNLSGGVWTLRIATRPSFDDALNGDQSLLILLTGVGLSVLLGALTLMLVTGRTRARALAMRMTATARESETRLRTVMTNLPVILFALDADGVFTLSDGAGLEPLGVAPGAVVGLSAFDVHADHPLIVENLRRALDGELTGFIHTIKGLTLDARVTPLRDTQGRVTGAIGVSVDVTDRVRAAQALRASEQRLQTVISNAPIVLTAVDAAGVVTFSAGGSVEKIGRTPHSTVGRSIFDILADAPDTHDYVRRALAGDTCTAVIHLRGVVFETHYAPLYDAAGRVDGAIGVSTDVTERWRSEVALAEQRRELERSNAELQQFAYVASHDLQEPLRTITSYLTLLQRRYGGQLGPDADEFIGFATDGAQRMSALIKAVLAYSRVGTHGAAFGPTDCGALVTTAVANLEARIVERGARVVCDATLPTVQGDAAQLGQLFQNLLGNALTFTRPDTPPVVRVAAERQGARWLVRVVDNGIGIAPAHSARIFQMFGRLHTRTEYAGTGIGLAVCQRIVERHGGRIWVESTPGQGATFLFTLPAAADGREDAAADGREDAAPDGREDAAA